MPPVKRQYTSCEQREIVFLRLPEKTKKILRAMHADAKHDRWPISDCIDCQDTAKDAGIRIPRFKELKPSQRQYPKDQTLAAKFPEGK